VDRAGDAFLVGVGRLGWLGRLGDEHLLRCIHHRADRGGLVLGHLAAAVQVGLTLLVLGLDGRGLDDTQDRLRCLGGGFGRSHCGGGRRGRWCGCLVLLLGCGGGCCSSFGCLSLLARMSFGGLAFGTF
jgi:hypothetical protein